MKTKTILMIGGLVVLFGGVLVVLFHRHSVPMAGKETPAPLKTATVPAEPTKPAQVTDASPTNSPNWPDDPRPEVRELYHFAKLARLYNFDPHVNYWREDTSPTGKKCLSIETPTHIVDFTDDILMKVTSKLDCSHSDYRDPEVRNEWYRCTGTWTEKEAVEATLNILRELGETNTLDAVQKGLHEYHVTRYRAKTPSGETVLVYPFVTVRLYDARNNLCARAEYRMGANGPVGLVDWFHL